MAGLGIRNREGFVGRRNSQWVSLVFPGHFAFCHDQKHLARVLFPPYQQPQKCLVICEYFSMIFAWLISGFFCAFVCFPPFITIPSHFIQCNISDPPQYSKVNHGHIFLWWIRLRGVDSFIGEGLTCLTTSDQRVVVLGYFVKKWGFQYFPSLRAFHVINISFFSCFEPSGPPDDIR